MNSLTALLYGQLVLVSVPGPTNALLGTSGATVGVYRSLLGGLLWLGIGNPARHAASRRLAGMIPKLSSVTLGVFAALLVGSLLA